MQVHELGLEVCVIVLPCQPVYTGGGVPFQLNERKPEEINADVVEERGEPFLLPLPAACRMRSSACDTLSPVLCPARAAGPHFPWPLLFAPSVPQLIARRCSPTSQLLRQSLTSRVGSSSAMAPRLSRIEEMEKRSRRRICDLENLLAS